MKNTLTNGLIILAIIVTGYLLLNPRTEIKIEKEYSRGDTTKIINMQSVIDSLSKLTFTQDSLLKIPKKYPYKFPAKIDTVYLEGEPEVYEPIEAKTAEFDLGSDSLGTSGTVSYYDMEFSFRDVEYRFPEVIKTITDTLKYTKTITKKPYLWENEWFYATVFFAVLYYFQTLGSK